MPPQEQPTVEELQAQIKTLQQQLNDAQKLTALGELASTTTHEFNNVLMAVINYAKMGMRYKDEATRDKSFAKILSASERAAKITNSVLGMARNRSSSLEPTDIIRLTQDALVLVEREMTKYRVSLETQFEEVPEAMCNGNQIQQVLLNLLINARQATEQGGRVLVRVAHDQQANTVDIVIRDSGCGIPTDQLPKIFEPFFTTKKGPDASGKGGTGLGLAACKDIIESHRGRIRVQSSVGKGTAFTIKLPAAVEAPRKTSPAAAANVGSTTIGSPQSLQR